MEPRGRVGWCVVAAATAALAFPGPVALSTEPAPSPGPGSAEISDTWGVEIVGVRRTAAETLLDFRFRVLDPGKALPLVDRQIKPVLIDQASGLELQVPRPPKVGPLRQTVRNGPPKAGRVYFILFGNPGRTVKRGGKVTLVIGDLVVKNMTVE